MSLMPQTMLFNPNQATEMCAIGPMYKHFLFKSNKLLNEFTSSLLENGSKHVFLMVGLFNICFKYLIGSLLS